ncbi:hypothetical protein [Maribacter antarcticus]|uniref:hypothetical protein n=1 Tax=Maribacter antarcticus TaxID=505250 RepID=UPI000AA9E298|nr:hypothetical protein [Maribacter antarcticus]
MRTLKCISIFLLIGIYFSCSDDEMTQEEESQHLIQQLSEIRDLASSILCTDATVWTFTSYGSKACGGPIGYIAYATTIDTQLFLQKIQEHTAAQQYFNKKWGIISDCAFTTPPSSVLCENGNPILEY